MKYVFPLYLKLLYQSFNWSSLNTLVYFGRTINVLNDLKEQYALHRSTSKKRFTTSKQDLKQWTWYEELDNYVHIHVQLRVIINMI